MNRRNFFKLIAGAAVVAAAPIGPLAKVPMIYCNGVDCDAEGLTALFRGDVVEFAHPELAEHIYWQGDVLNLAGEFQVHTPIEISGMGRKVLRGGRYDIYSDVGFRVSDSSNLIFTEMHFQGHKDNVYGAVFLPINDTTMLIPERFSP